MQCVQIMLCFPNCSTPVFLSVHSDRDWRGVDTLVAVVFGPTRSSSVAEWKVSSSLGGIRRLSELKSSLLLVRELVV